MISSKVTPGSPMARRYESQLARPGIGAGIAGIDRHRLGEFLPRHVEGALAPAALQEIGAAHQVIAIGLGIAGGPLHDGRQLLGQQLHLECGDDALRDLVLQAEDVFAPALIALGPDMPAAAAVDQLGGDAHAPSALRTLPSST